MPFHEDFRDIYTLGIKETCNSVGVRCEHADDQKFDERILDHICSQIRAADLIIADMTGSNPNVYYEVGYAHAMDKRLSLLTQDAKGIPFDLNQNRHVIYQGRISNLKSQLTEELLWCIRTPKPDLGGSTSRSIVKRIIRILGQVSNTVSGQQQLRPLLDAVLEEMTAILDAEVCSIFLCDSQNRSVIKCVAASGFAHAIEGIAEYRAGEGFTGKVFQRGQTTIIGSGDELKELRERKEFKGKYDHLQWASYGGRSQFRNGIAAPLKIGQDTIGVIKVENKRGRDFDADDVMILEAIANGVLAAALQNAKLFTNPAGKTKAVEAKGRKKQRRYTYSS